MCTICDAMGCSLPGSSVYGIFPGKTTEVGCLALFQGIFLTQGSNLCVLSLLHCRQILFPWAIGVRTTIEQDSALTRMSSDTRYTRNIKWNKPVTKGQILYASKYMRDSKVIKFMETESKGGYRWGTESVFIGDSFSFGQWQCPMGVGDLVQQ